jgi:amino acid permease
MFRLIALCLSISLGIYSIFAISFYGVFGSSVLTNVINNFPATGAPYMAARILYALLMIFSYPLQTFPARGSLVKLASGYFGEAPRTMVFLHIGCTLSVVLTTWLVALLELPLGLLLTLVGCTAGPIICYFLPAMFWWKLEEGRPLTKGKIACIILFIFGIAATIIPFVALVIPFVVKKV